MQNMINWFEIPAVDFERAVTFYTSVLGVAIEKAEMMGSTMGFFPSEDGKVSGAIVKGPDYAPSGKGVLVYLNGGTDLQHTLSKVEPAGGRVFVPKTQITPEMGYFAIFADTEGNTMALHSMA